MKILNLHILILVITGSSSHLKQLNTQEKTTLSKKKKEILQTSQPVKGKFLDYLYQIRPNHRQEGFSFNTEQSYNGYAFGYGRYDDWHADYYLFRGQKKT